MVEKAEILTAPGSQPAAFFKKELFDNSIWQHGYDVIIEKAIRCPCKSEKTDNLSSCRNCGSTGWVFVNKLKTKAILKSMNLNTQFKDWSELNMGNVSISVRDTDRISFMDRLTVLCSESIHTQTSFPKLYQNVMFSFLDYPVVEIEACFMFFKADEPLVLLKETVDYTISENKIILNKKFHNIEDLSLSLRYTHSSQFHVIDLPRDIMISSVKSVSTGQIIKAQMPINAIGRRAHYILGAQDYNGTMIFDNSYTTKKCGHKHNCNCPQ